MLQIIGIIQGDNVIVVIISVIHLHGVIGGKPNFAIKHALNSKKETDEGSKQ